VDKFVKEIILAYFKAKKESYSFHELASILGLSKNTVTEYIQGLIEEGMLGYDDGLLHLMPKGRLSIQNKPVDYFVFDEVGSGETLSKEVFQEKWPIDKVYYPKNFLDKYR